MRVTVTAAAKPGVDSMQIGDVETCKAEVTLTNISTCMEKSAAANVASFASSRKNNEYIKGRFQSAGYLATCEGNIKPDPDIIPPSQNSQQEKETATWLQEQHSKESSQPSGKQKDYHYIFSYFKIHQLNNA